MVVNHAYSRRIVGRVHRPGVSAYRLGGDGGAAEPGLDNACYAKHDNEDHRRTEHQDDGFGVVLPIDEPTKELTP